MADGRRLARVGQVARELGVEDQRRRAALVERVGDLGRGLARVQRNEDGADAGAGEQRLDKGEAVAHEDGHALAGSDGGAGEPAGDARGAVLKRAVADGAFLAYERVLAGMRAGGSGEHGVDRSRALAEAGDDAAEMRLASELDRLFVVPVHALSLDRFASCGERCRRF